MRAALISLPQAGDGAMPVVAGKSIAHRQLLFAKEAGCTSVVGFGSGGSTDGIDLRHAAERAGMKYQVISTAHALAGLIAHDDSLLLLQPGLLPESRAALELLKAEGDRVLVVSAGPGVSAGLERIDLDRAWAGALTVPGEWLDRVTTLPEDADPHGALLRIALQQRLPEARLADTVLDDGKWSVITSEEAAQERALVWQRTHLGKVSGGALSQWIAAKLATGPAQGLLGLRYGLPSILGLAGLLLGAGVAAGYYEMPLVGFVLAALSVPVLELFLAVTRLSVAPFGKIGKWPILRRCVDVAILALGIMAIDSLPHRVVFPPIVLASALLLLDRKAAVPWVETLRDRMVIAGLVTILAAVSTPELAIMLVAMFVIAGNIIPDRS